LEDLEPVSRRLFDHLHAEISVHVGMRIPRYALWLRLHDLGHDPEMLTPREATAFCRGKLGAFLAQRGLDLDGRALRHLHRSVSRFDPEKLTPYEHMVRLGERS
jgi:hypothetical protein